MKNEDLKRFYPGKQDGDFVRLGPDGKIDPSLYEQPTPGTDVSGTDDGTNWTGITIGGKTRAIPQGGGGGSKYMHCLMINDMGGKFYGSAMIINDYASDYAGGGEIFNWLKDNGFESKFKALPFSGATKNTDSTGVVIGLYAADNKLHAVCRTIDGSATEFIVDTSSWNAVTVSDRAIAI